MIRVQKFKFENRFESFETMNINAAVKALNGYRFCGGNLWVSTKFVGEYALCDVLDVNGKPIKSI